MITPRNLQLIALSLSAAVLSGSADGQPSDRVTVSIRADEMVRAVIPPIEQSSLTIAPDRSEAAQNLAQRSPPERAVPVLLIIVGAIAVAELAQMIKEMLRQTYYGGVMIDARKEPPSITSDPKIPGYMVFVVDPHGTTTKYTSDQISPELLGQLLKAR
jgi:hypothetical protein